MECTGDEASHFRIGIIAKARRIQYDRAGLGAPSIGEGTGRWHAGLENRLAERTHGRS